jgi:hypothetical protein
VNERVQTAVKDTLANIAQLVLSAVPDTKELSLVHLVAEDAKSCFDKEATLAKISDFYKAALAFSLPSQLAELYGADAVQLDYSSQQVPGEAQLARWFEQQSADNFFVKTGRADSQEEDTKSSTVSRFRRPAAKPPDTLYSVDDGLQNCVCVRLSPLYPNIPAWVAVFIAIPSRRLIATPLVRLRFEEVAWNDYKPKDISIRSRKTAIADFVGENTARDAIKVFVEYVDMALRKQFSIAGASQEEGDNARPNYGFAAGETLALLGPRN